MLGQSRVSGVSVGVSVDGYAGRSRVCVGCPLRVSVTMTKVNHRAFTRNRVVQPLLVTAGPAWNQGFRLTSLSAETHATTRRGPTVDHGDEVTPVKARMAVAKSKFSYNNYLHQ